MYIPTNLCKIKLEMDEVETRVRSIVFERVTPRGYTSVLRLILWLSQGTLRADP